MSTNPNNLIPMRVWSDTPTPPRREALWLAEGKVCHWCHKPTRLCSEVAADQATVEHIIPRGRGGTDDPSNLASACHMCNQRRAYEEQCGLPDGKLLGTYPVTPGQKRQYGINVPKQPQGKPNYYRHIALTGDEKKAIIAGTGLVGSKKTEDVLREQRDQAQKEITTLRKEMKQWEATVAEQEIELKSLKSMTVWKFIRKRLSEWIKP